MSAYTDHVLVYPGYWPGYIYSRPAERPTLPIPAPDLASMCECGADKAGCGGGGAHSDWCPKGAGK